MYFDFRLWALTAGMRLGMAGSVALGLLALSAGIARFVFLGQFLARVFQGAPWQDLVFPLTGAAAMVLLRALLDHRRTVQAHQSALKAQQILRARLYDRIVALGPAWFATKRTGGVMLTLVDGVEQLETFFGQYLPQVAIALVAPFAIFAVIAFWDVPVALVLLAAALFALLGPVVVHRLDRKASMARSQSLDAFGESFLDAMQGLPTLKAFGQGKTYGARLAEKARALSDNTFWVLSVTLLTRGMSDLGIALGAALALVLGAWRVMQGEMSVEALLIVLMAGTEIFRPLRDLRSVLHKGMLGQSAAHNVHALMDAEVSVPRAGHEPAKDLTPTIEFDAVSFSYPGGRMAHNGLSFKVAAGERVGVVG
ncbi:MAG: ABC transporter, partial [Comamonadaceae bacterium]